jgi:IS5 family transposase
MVITKISRLSLKIDYSKHDPETYFMNKGNQCYFGMKISIGMDIESKTAHSLVKPLLI